IMKSLSEQYVELNSNLFKLLQDAYEQFADLETKMDSSGQSQTEAHLAISRDMESIKAMLQKSKAPVDDLPKEEEKPTLMRLNTDLHITLDYTIAFDDLKFGEPLGQGAVGKVYRGEYKQETVAIKQFEFIDFSEDSQKLIRAEAAIMAGIQS